MKALFVHGHVFQIDSSGLIYSHGQFPYHRWNRYLEHFDNLKVIGRLSSIKEENLKTLDKSSGPNVSFDWIPNLNKFSNLVYERRKAKTIIKKAVEDSDAVIVRLGEPAWLAAFEAERQRKPWAIEVVADPWDSYWNYGSWRAKIFAPLAWAQARFWINKAPFAIYVTQSILQTRYPCKGYVSYASNVEIESPDIMILKSRLGREAFWNSKSKNIIIGIIGSLRHRYKGIEVAFQALQEIKNKIPDFELHILGPGDPTPWKNLANEYGLHDCVFFDGVRPSGKPVLNWLDSVDIYLQPSFQEGLPRTLIEAMSRGCPSLGSTAGGIPELLNEDCLHQPGNFVTLQRQIIRMVKDSSWRVQQIKRNFEVAKEYSKDVLDKRRNTFWRAFAEYAREQKLQSLAMFHNEEV